MYQIKYFFPYVSAIFSSYINNFFISKQLLRQNYKFVSIIISYLQLLFIFSMVRFGNTCFSNFITLIIYKKKIITLHVSS